MLYPSMPETNKKIKELINSKTIGQLDELNSLLLAIKKVGVRKKLPLNAP
jgi:hypothetical protein